MIFSMAWMLVLGGVEEGQSRQQAAVPGSPLLSLTSRARINQP
jgi:hypothetical protein